MKTTVTTTLDIEDFKAIKAKRYRMNELIMLGFAVKENGNRQIMELTESNEKILDKLKSLTIKNWELEKQIMDIAETRLIH